MEAYVKDWLEWGERMRAEQDRNPPPVVVRSRALKAQQQEARVPACSPIRLLLDENVDPLYRQELFDASRAWLSGESETSVRRLTAPLTPIF